MYKLERKDYVNNASFNIIEDDPTMKNYLAFALTIAGAEINDDRDFKKCPTKDIEIVYEDGVRVAYPSSSIALKTFGISDKKDCLSKVVKRKASVKYRVTNIKTGMSKIITSFEEIVKLTGIKKKHVSAYSKTGHTYNGEWKFEKLHKGNAKSTRKIRVTDINGEHEQVFDSIKDTATYFKKSDATIHGYINKKSHPLYIFEYID